MLEVGIVAELGCDGSAYIFQVVNGSARYFLEHEMRSVCEGHNKFIESENEIIVRNVQKALSVICKPGCEFRRHTLEECSLPTTRRETQTIGN